jgi:site-specific DNA-methyltransferase (adenine-specific)
MFVFSKGKPKTFNPIQMEKVRNKEEKVWYRQKDWSIIRKTKEIGRETKDASNVREYAVAWWNGTGHPAVFPEKLAEDHILSWSNEWDLVFDPFMWSWTTAKMAKMNNRNFIWCDISQEYVDIANKRLETTTVSLF